MIGLYMGSGEARAVQKLLDGSMPGLAEKLRAARLKDEIFEAILEVWVDEAVDGQPTMEEVTQARALVKEVLVRFKTLFDTEPGCIECRGVAVRVHRLSDATDGDYYPPDELLYDVCSCLIPTLAYDSDSTGSRSEPSPCADCGEGTHWVLGTGFEKEFVCSSCKQIREEEPSDGT